MLHRCQYCWYKNAYCCMLRSYIARINVSILLEQKCILLHINSYIAGISVYCYTGTHIAGSKCILLHRCLILLRPKTHLAQTASCFTLHWWGAARRCHEIFAALVAFSRRKDFLRRLRFYFEIFVLRRLRTCERVRNYRHTAVTEANHGGAHEK